jgi:hypothetical protein
LRITCSFSPAQEVLDLEQAHPSQRADEVLDRRRIRAALGLLQDRVNGGRDLGLVGKQGGDHVGEGPELLGKLEARADEEDEAPTVAHRRRGIPERPKLRAIGLEQRMEVLE